MGDKLGKLIAESMAIEAEDATQAAVGFVARALTQAADHAAQNPMDEPIYPNVLGVSPSLCGHPDKSDCLTGRFPGCWCRG